MDTIKKLGFPELIESNQETKPSYKYLTDFKLFAFTEEKVLELMNLFDELEI